MTPLVARHKRIHGGVPVIRGTRVPVSVLVQYALEKDGLERARQEFPQLSKQQILAAWKYAEQQLFASVHDAPAKI